MRAGTVFKRNVTRLVDWESRPSVSSPAFLAFWDLHASIMRTGEARAFHELYFALEMSGHGGIAELIVEGLHALKDLGYLTIDVDGMVLPTPKLLDMYDGELVNS